MSDSTRCAALAAMALFAAAQSALAIQYETSYLSGGSWNTVYVQGFNTSLAATPDPGVSVGSPVTMSKFEFFKSGNADAASNIRLAIINSMFPDSPPVNAMTSTSPTVVGLSTNTIAGTVAIATGAPIAFDFADLALTYGSNYAAVFVNVGIDVGNGAPLTPVLVSALTANYAEVSPGVFEPVPNYGGNANFNLATSNSISGSGFFNTFSFAGDANFRATLNAVPEPGALLLVLIGTIGAAFASRRRCS